MQRLKNPALAEQTPQQRWFRRSMRYRGDGDYRDWAKYIPRGIGALAGAGAGYMTGGLNGAWGGGRSGWDQGASFSKMVGMGDYGAPVGNAIIEGAGGPPAGITVNASDDLTGDIYLSHKEFITQVVASSATAGASASPFQQNRFAINPGMKESFPWLSQLAQNYDLFEFQGLIYEYRPQMGEFANSNNNLGRMMMVTQYDPDAEPFPNSIALQNYDYACSAKPSLGLIHGVETKRIQSSVNIFYTRTGDSTKDKVFTDLGVFNIATEGIPFSAPGTQILGELWVTYRVKLSRARLFQSLGSSVEWDLFTNASNSVSAQLWPQATVATGSANTGNWTSLQAGATQVNFTSQPTLTGTYMIRASYFAGANGDLANQISFNIISGAVFNGQFQRNTGTTISQIIQARLSPSGAPTTTTAYITLDNSPAVPAVISLSNSAAGSTNSITRVEFIQVPAAVATAVITV